MKKKEQQRAAFKIINIQKKPSFSKIRKKTEYLQGIFVSNTEIGDRYWINIKRSGAKDFLPFVIGDEVLISYDKYPEELADFGVEEKTITLMKKGET